MMHHDYRGYTLIELIVSVALFSIVMLVATSAFLALIEMDRRARATNDVVTNLSYAIDSMERSIRTGSNYSACATVCNSFSFTDYQGQAITYLMKTDGTVGQCTGGGCTSSSATSLTDPRITIETLDFRVSGEVRGDAIQPRVFFDIKGYIQPRPQDAQIRFLVEGGASQRLIDI